MGQVAKLKKDLESSPSLPNFSKDYWKLLYLLISINWPSLMTSWVVVQKIYSKMHFHRDVTDLVNHGMVKNTTTWISWERNIIFLRNKKILNLCFRLHILRSYRFLAEVTFKHFTYLSKKVNIWAPVRYFPFLFHFSVEMWNKKSQIKKDTRKMDAEKIFNRSYWN